MCSSGKLERVRQIWGEDRETLFLGAYGRPVSCPTLTKANGHLSRRPYPSLPACWLRSVKEKINIILDGGVQGVWYVVYC